MIRLKNITNSGFYKGQPEVLRVRWYDAEGTVNALRLDPGETKEFPDHVVKNRYTKHQLSTGKLQIVSEEIAA